MELAESLRTDRPPALGALESSSLSRGMKALDAAQKQAPVDLAFRRVIEPGTFLFGFTGEVDAVRDAVQAARHTLSGACAGHVVLPKPHSALLRGLEAARCADGYEGALGLIETSALCPALLAADVALKHADVELLHLRLEGGMGGRALIVLAGPEDETESAVSAGADAAQEQNALFETAVITGPSPELLSIALGL